MQEITVVNAMLATMGESPLNSIEDPHAFRAACLSTLDSEDARIQAKGWWFNQEVVTMTPQTNDRIPLPGDAISVRTPARNIVQRGRYLYDTDTGDYLFYAPVKIELIRRVPFGDLPESAAQYIKACSVVQFQTNYDGDTAKTRDLRIIEARTFAEINIDHIRNRRSNMIDSNVNLQRLKSTTNGLRYRIR